MRLAINVAAMIAHLCGIISTHIIGAYHPGIWDLGHYLLPHYPCLRIVVEVGTIVAPLITGLHNGTRAVRLFTVLTILRGILIVSTILPAITISHHELTASHLLVGHSRDFIFSGHAAFVASWLLQEKATPVTIVYGIGHGLLILVTRMHYTVDVLLAWAMAYLVHRLKSLRKRKITPRELRLKLPTDCLENLQRRVWTDELRQRPAHEKAHAAGTTIVAWEADTPIGYITVTPPCEPASLDRHFKMKIREPHEYEIRALTVHPDRRGRGVGTALMYAALRYVEVAGGDSIIIMARNRVLSTYIGMGFTHDNTLTKHVGPVEYTVARADAASIRASLNISHRSPWLAFQWGLPFEREKPAATACFHGGERFSLCHDTESIDADVLDAWYPPSPDVLAAVAHRMGASMHMTPPTYATELRLAISHARHISPENLVIGAGSSDLMYRCFLHWLTPQSHVLLVDPTYGEYAHLLENVIDCSVTTIRLRAADNFDIDLGDLVRETQQNTYDMVIIVNPNSPTGRWADLATVLPQLAVPKVWVDETYIDFAAVVGQATSVEQLAAKSTNVVVCKSLSKIYGLSGIRLGYLCASEALLDAIKLRTPPWVASRLAQAAGVAAFTPASVEYYRGKLSTTRQMRAFMEQELQTNGMRCIQGSANFIMAQPPLHISADELVDACRVHKLYIRSFITPEDGTWVRITVKDPATTKSMLSILKSALAPPLSTM